MRSLAIAAVVVALVGGCGDDSGPSGEACASTADCAAGERCVNGVCTTGRDAGADAASDVGTDAAPDADGADATPADAAVACDGGADCPPGSYCGSASCDGPGMCAPRPEGCPDVEDPVCGCDGVTYANACEAASAGIRVAAEGACGCGSNDDCAAGSYCAAASCGGPGECTVRPEFCPRNIDPVCGCDGVTYNNACLAAAAGARVASSGMCAPASCEANGECSPEDYCDAATCGGVGMCTPRPTRCSSVIDPVCGCDGRSYGNACLAAQAGVRLDPRGICRMIDRR